MRELAGLLLLFLAAELVALLIVCVQAWRNPHGKEPALRVPDHVPPEWGPMGGIDVLPTYPVDPQEAPPMGGLPASGGGSNETRSGDPRSGPYDQRDDLPGWGVPNGDTQPATDTPSDDRGVGGESP